MKIEKEVVFREYIQSEKWMKKDKDFVNHFKKCRICGGADTLSSRHICFKNFGNESVKDVEVLCWLHQTEQKLISLEGLNIKEPPLLEDLKRIVQLRNIFAHVPVNWFSKEPGFSDNPRYKHYFEFDEKWKNVSFAVKEFMNLQKEFLDLIIVYIKLVISKRDLFSNILLGKSYKEINNSNPLSKN